MDASFDWDEAITRLHEAGPAPCVGLGFVKATASELSRARAYNFIVFPTVKEAVKLKPPIRWEQDPFNSRPWRAQLHSLRFLRVLVTAYTRERDIEALRTAATVVLDWIDHNRPAKARISEYAWSDKLTGDRGVMIGYLLRAAAHERLLPSKDVRRLFQSALEHVSFLQNDENYVGSTNHGLFQDAGLLFLAYYLNFLPDAAVWRDQASGRFVKTFSSFVEHDEGIFLEHSPAYQWTVLNLIGRLEEAGELDGRISELAGQLRSASKWIVLPDGRTPPIGDSDLLPAPPAVRRTAQTTQGIRLFRRAGWAVVKVDRSMLMVTAGYHSHAHKHADELGFCLFEADELILGEAGKYGYDKEDAARQYALSSHAHNVLIVDDEGFKWRGTEPYGGAIKGIGHSGHWYAIEGTNPLLERQQVTHNRLFIYQPGQVLVVLDKVKSHVPHRYTRLFHFGPNVRTRNHDTGLQFFAGELHGTLMDASGIESSMAVSIGERTPRMSGWMFPRYRQWIPISTVALESPSVQADKMELVTVVSMTGQPPGVTVCANEDKSTVLSLAFDASTLNLHIASRDDGSIDLSTCSDEGFDLSGPTAS